MSDGSPPCTPAGATSSDATIRASLERLTGMLQGEVENSAFDAADFERICDELRRLHARIRMHHAAICVESGGAGEPLPPELAGERERLVSEYTAILGLLDVIIRSGDAISDRQIEDKDVFILRVHELAAILRRHMAEEDRLFYLAVWREVGGES